MFAALASVVSFSNGVPTLEQAYKSQDSVVVQDRTRLVNS